MKLLFDFGDGLTDFKTLDDNLRQPLHYAAQANDNDICNLLIDRGAEVEAMDHVGRRPIHFAAISPIADWEVCACLLARGADIHSVDNEGIYLSHFTSRILIHDYCSLSLSLTSHTFHCPSPRTLTCLRSASHSFSRNSHRRTVFRFYGLFTHTRCLFAPLYLPYPTVISQHPSSPTSHYYLLRSGCDVDERTMDGRTPLFFAACQRF